eukprot:GHVR01083956.1.p1 GENE.GHVR01083956.1~~GHVR01083956.1.p1  ORF type:complete len:161 (-),score=31.10 GHVR01083956.1:78-560(-)
MVTVEVPADVPVEVAIDVPIDVSVDNNNSVCQYGTDNTSSIDYTGNSSIEVNIGTDEVSSSTRQVTPMVTSTHIINNTYINLFTTNQTTSTVNATVNIDDKNKSIIYPLPPDVLLEKLLRPPPPPHNNVMVSSSVEYAPPWLRDTDVAKHPGGTPNVSPL